MSDLKSLINSSDGCALSEGNKIDRLGIGLFCLLDCNNHGGLEAYTRQLAGSLQAAGRVVKINGMPPEECLGMSRKWQPRINRLLPLMTRRHTRWVARLAAELWGENWCAKAIANCDIVHFVGTGWDLLGFPLAGAARRAGKVMTCLPAVHPGTWGDANLDIDLYKRMDSVFVLSDYEAMQLSRLGVVAEKLVRCVCAPDSPRAVGNGDRFRAKHGAERKRIVLFIGRKSRSKGYHAIREAVANLAIADSTIVLVSIGRDVEPPYPLIAAEINIDLGAADDATKQDALAACDVFALPSEAESFGIVYVEAWTYGKPVICGTAPASRELVTRHGVGLACDGSVAGIEAAIAELFNAPDRARAMGQAGREVVKAKYTPERVVQTHLQTWERLLRDRT